MSEVAGRAALAELASQVARTFARADMLDGRAFIRTPVLFPSGATAVVVIEQEAPDQFRVTDLGQGHDEAELMDMAGTYRRQAQEIANLSGITTDGTALLLTGVNARQLPGAVMVLANAVVRALERASFRAANRAEPAAVARLVARLTRIFPLAEIRQEAEMRGASTHPWRFDAVMTIDERQAVFEIVTPHATSVAFAAAKFHDLARLEHPPARLAWVHRKAALGDLLPVVAQAARIIEDDTPDRALARAALAA